MIRTPVPCTRPPEIDPERWSARLSLAEYTQAARDRNSAGGWVDKDGDTGLFDLYARTYEKQIGKRLNKRTDLRIVRMMDAAKQFCEKNGLDLPLYVAAQMVLLRDWVKTTKYGFQPNMLLGEAALGRYNAYVRKLDRRFNHASEDVSAEADKAMREALFASEFSIGAHLTAEAVNGKALNWNGAVEAASPADAWWACTSGHKAPTREARKLALQCVIKHGKGWMDSAASLARLEAACAVADRYAASLSERIGMNRGGFAWLAFAELMGSLFYRPVSAPAGVLPDAFGLKRWG